MRFFWRKREALETKEDHKVKILRKVVFPLVFDVFDFCTDSLKA
jgi:hypothetical protein